MQKFLFDSNTHHLLVASILCCSLFTGCGSGINANHYDTYQPAPVEAENPFLTEQSIPSVSALEVENDTVSLSIAQAKLAVTGTPGAPLIENVADDSNPKKIELLVPTKIFRTEGAEQALRVSYDDLDLLKVLNMEPVPADAVNYFPAWLQELNGKHIRIRGFMYPEFEETGIEHFVLARDNQICCFGRNPKIYDLIDITMKAGVTTKYIPNRPFDVTGIFRIKMVSDQGVPLGLYWVEDANVILK